MDIIIGGGKYGCEAIEHLRKGRKSFIVVDNNPRCLATQKYKLRPYVEEGKEEGEYFLQGDLGKVLELIDSFEPEYVFPTAPVHIAAELVRLKFELCPWIEEIDKILFKLPPTVVLRAGRGNLVLSYNRDEDCVDKCGVPEVCPSTLKRKPCSMEKLMRFAYPKGFFLISHLMAPGMGAFKGSELVDFFSWAEDKNKFVIATACDCHGCFSCFKKK